MMGDMMMVCMIAGTLLALAVLVTLVVQTVLQAKILRELRRLHVESQRAPQNAERKA
jgi:heme exporter protein D